MYKDYEAVIRVDDKENETLCVRCKSKKEAEELVVEVYNAYVKMKYINSFKLVGIYAK